jgi:SagB-type dehydrogenase family enzyme
MTDADINHRARLQSGGPAISDDRDTMPRDIRGYHRRTKHAPTRYAMGPAFLDWTSQPSPFRRFDGARLIELPLLDQAATPPFPGPAQDPEPFDRAAIALFCELGFGISAWKSYEGSTWALRNNPSSGNLHPTEAYLLTNTVDGLGATAALYHYAPQEHALEERARYEVAHVLPLGGFLLGLGSVPWREAWKYGERAFRYCQLDAGHAIGAAAQAAAALGWRAHVLTGPSDDDVAALLGLNRSDAAHRREEEHPDLLLWIATDAGSAPSDLRTALEAPRHWSGAANRLSEDHDGWPVVDRAAHHCRKAGEPSLEAVSALPIKIEFATPDIGEVVRRRRSAQRMDGVAVLSLENFRAMLMATLPRAAPLLSALPWPPRLALLFFVHRVEGLEQGLYLLERDEESALRLRAAASADFLWAPVDLEGARLLKLRSGCFEREATMTACRQPIAGKGCFSVAMIADYEQTLVESGDFGYRRLHWEAGLIGQALYLWASAIGLAGTGIGCFFDDEIHALLGLTDSSFQDIYHFTVGSALEDQRMLTLTAYPPEFRERK